jgi:predicted metalloenzyme YecM
MFNSASDFFNASQEGVALFNTFAEKHQLAGRAQADHICYKCGSSGSFEAVRALLESESDFIYQSLISQRRIAYIKFKKGLETALDTLRYLELSDQKPDGSQEEGFDHIEVFPTQGTYEEMVASLALTENVIHVERPHHTTDDVELEGGFIFRCTRGPLIQKIKADEMV